MHEQAHHEIGVDAASPFRWRRRARGDARADQGAGQWKGVEEIVARVNNEIITLSDYEKAQAQLHEEVAPRLSTCTPDRKEAMYAERQKNLAAR